MRNILNAIYMVVVIIVLASCESGSANDFMGLEEEIPTPTPTDTTTHRPTTDPNTWTTVYGGDATMDNNGYVQRYLLIARQDGKSDSVTSNYNVVMTLEDTIRVQYSGNELKLLGTEQTLYPTGSESYSEGTDHVFRATEETAWNVYCGAVEVPVSITRQLAKVVVKGKEEKFEFGSYNFDAEKTNFRTYVDTIESKIYRHDILDGRVHMRQGYGDYAKSFVVIMDRFIGEVETTPETPDMPGTDFTASAVKGVFSTITPIFAGTQVSSWVTTLTVVGEKEVSVYDVNTKKLLAKGSTSTYKNVNTAVFVNNEWKLACVEKGSNLSYVYRWGNGTNEAWTVKENLFCIGGAQNLQEDNSARQNPFVTVNTTHKDYANGTVYTLTGINGSGKVIFAFTVGVAK